MKAVVHHEFGKPREVVRCEERPVPVPGSNQVRVRTKLAPVHNHDFLTIKGDYGNKTNLPVVGDLIYRQTQVQGFWASKLVLQLTSEEFKAISDKLVQLAVNRKRLLPVEATFSFDQAADAMVAYKGARNGKIMFQA